MFQQMTHSILSSSLEDKILFILHGGEPTILPDNWFEKNFKEAYAIADAYGKKLEFSIQTNLIDISESKLHIFKKHNVSIGGSLDNPAFLKKSFRPLAQQALNTYLHAKELGIKIGILATINASNINNMGLYCEWLMNSLKVHHFKANVAYSVGAGLELTVPNATSIFNAQRDIIEFMIDTDGALVEENLSEEIIRYFENYHGGKERVGTLCDDKRCGAGNKVVGVTPQGNLLPCGRFAWSDNQFVLGNLDEKEDQHSSVYFEKLEEFQEMSPENWQHCSQCEARDVCSYGCQAFIVRSKSKHNIECKPTQLRFNYYQQNVTKLQGLYERICELKDKPVMSRLDQKLSKLRKLVPQGYHVIIQKELQNALQDRIN
jgi:uncharacterized protein